MAEQRFVSPRVIDFANASELLTLVSGVLTKIVVDIEFQCSGSSTFLQRGSPPPPPWRLLPEYFICVQLDAREVFP